MLKCGNDILKVSNYWLVEPELRYTITYGTTQHGTITGPASVAPGTTVTVTATADSGYALSYITVNGVQITGTSFVVTGDTVVGAVFAELGPSYTLEIIFNGTGYDHAGLAIRSMSPNASNFKYVTNGSTYNYSNPTSVNSTSGNGQYFGTNYPDPTFVATAVLEPSYANAISFEIRNYFSMSWAQDYTYNITETGSQEILATGTITIPNNTEWQQCSISLT